MANGEITSEQAQGVCSVLESQRKLTETVELKTLLGQIKQKIYE